MRQRKRFDFDLPLMPDQVVENGSIVFKERGTLNLDGICYLEHGEYSFDLEEVRYKKPKNHPDYHPFGQKLDLEMMKAVSSWIPTEEDFINAAILDHARGLFTEHLDIVTDLVQDDKAA